MTKLLDEGLRLLVLINKLEQILHDTLELILTPASLGIRQMGDYIRHHIVYSIRLLAELREEQLGERTDLGILVLKTAS